MLDMVHSPGAVSVSVLLAHRASIGVETEYFLVPGQSARCLCGRRAATCRQQDATRQQVRAIPELENFELDLESLRG